MVRNDTDAASLDDEQRDFLRRCTERPEAVDPDELFALLDSEGDERTLGARALRNYTRAAPGRMVDHGDRLVSYLDDEREAVRQSAIASIHRLVDGNHDAFAEPPIRPLIDRLGREDQQTSKTVAETLAALLETGDAAVIEAVDTTVDLFEGDQFEAGSGIQALVVLGRSFPEPVMDRLGDRLRDDDPDVRKYSVRALAALATDYPQFVVDATPTLLDVLSDEDDYTREHTLSALLQAAKADPASMDGAVPALVSLVDADHDRVRRGAVRILAELGRADVDVSEAVTALRDRLDDSDKIARRDAVYALGILRAEEALVDIQELTDHQDLELQAVAASAVERITEGESDPPMAELDPGEIFLARQ